MQTHLIPTVITLVPTLIWVSIWVWIRPRCRSFSPLVVGIIVGAGVAVPVWFAEVWIDGTANTRSRLALDFQHQFLGAACCEELLKLVGVALLLRWMGASKPRPWHAIPIALTVGIGFMTVENIIAVMAAQEPMSMAYSRLVTVLAGHPGYQLVMGFCIARWSTHHRIGWAVASIGLPILLHGWGDLSEQLFKDEPKHGSTRDTLEFAAWIASITTVLIASLLVVAYAAKSARREMLSGVKDEA